ncbi:hypothetical protein LTR10_000883 [Elasticomyces elasticus]|nr:hypothetical protein LTR10_000883 [Elasticomyces elasticus]KAK4979870.1 hypothetical protein LTR42_000177 [Elasticomyces elasticus]
MLLPSTEDKFPPPEATDADTLVKLVVGDGDAQKTFKAHKGVLTFYSSWFNAALNGEFREALEGTVKLPTEDSAIVRLFIYWTRTRHFCKANEDPMEVISYDTLARLWIFGDSHEVPLCQDAVCDIFALKLYRARRWSSRMVTGLATDIIDYILLNSPPHQATLQKLLHDAVCFCYDWGSTMYLDGYWKHRHAQIESLDLLMEAPKPHKYQIRLRRGWDPFDRDGCRWHVHPGGESCPEEDDVEDEAGETGDQATSEDDQESSESDVESEHEGSEDRSGDESSDEGGVRLTPEAEVNIRSFY